MSIVEAGRCLCCAFKDTLNINVIPSSMVLVMCRMDGEPGDKEVAPRGREHQSYWEDQPLQSTLSPIIPFILFIYFSLYSLVLESSLYYLGILYCSIQLYLSSNQRSSKSMVSAGAFDTIGSLDTTGGGGLT